jgi:hypothetical protein
MKIHSLCVAGLLLSSLSGLWAEDLSYKDVVIAKIDTAENTIVVSGDSALKNQVLQTDGSVHERLTQLHKGDHLTLFVSKQAGNTTVNEILLTESAVAVRERIEVVALSGLVWLLLGLALARGNVMGLIVGTDGRYSNSKFQAVLWFSILLVAYGATVVLRYLRLGADLMWVNIPANLLLLSGLSAFSFGAAKGITVSKVEDAMAATGNDPKQTPSAGLIKDLTMNDLNKLDLGDFQMLVVTLIAVASYMVIAFHAMGALVAVKNATLSDVDTTILASFGIGQGAYLTKKALGPLKSS